MDAAAPFPTCSPPFLVAVVSQAFRDAEVVAGFVRDLQARSPRPLKLTRTILLGIAFAIRLRRWELCGITLHVDAGLPTSEAALHSVFKEPSNRKFESIVTQWHLRALRLYCQYFVWSAQDCGLQADIAVVAVQDESFLDSLADFLLAASELTA